MKVEIDVSDEEAATLRAGGGWEGETAAVAWRRFGPRIVAALPPRRFEPVAGSWVRFTGPTGRLWWRVRFVEDEVVVCDAFRDEVDGSGGDALVAQPVDAVTATVDVWPSVRVRPFRTVAR